MSASGPSGPLVLSVNIDSLCPSQQFFSPIVTFPGLNQY